MKKRLSLTLLAVPAIAAASLMVGGPAMADTASDTDLLLDIPTAGELQISSDASAAFTKNGVDGYRAEVGVVTFDTRNSGPGNYSVSAKATDLRGAGVIAQTKITSDIVPGKLVVAQGDGTATASPAGAFVQDTAKPIASLTGATTNQNRLNIQHRLSIAEADVTAAASGSYSGKITYSVI